jgi:hypothetical protein
MGLIKTYGVIAPIAIAALLSMATKSDKSTKPSPFISSDIYPEPAIAAWLSTGEASPRSIIHWSVNRTID